ncbi:PilZ domain-containing protein [Sphingomonas sp. HF-S4]|uniref:PilZ domain-containing protein n=1 Tax=Sphingomonas agrestis TaxID=3080540 RepID=A0ABU3YBK2_9SPHN|nr:PilZ domain-containing protein [Sphingomonas sp. HF-S4]MDV3458756.1 PilZ domain-containing protein [Sphingomonas sp. HF-S4]
MEVAYPTEDPRSAFEWERARQVGQAPLPGFRPRVKAVAQPAARVERRADARSKMSVYRSATLRWGGREVLCLIRNLSATGMMCRSVARPGQGDRVEVEMRSGECVPGIVVWTRDAQIGIRFDAQIDVSTVLNARVRTPQASVQRMPRLRAGCTATLIAESGRQSVTLLDLSQGGAKIEAGCLREGEHVTLGVVGLEPRSGTVRWVQAGRAGIAFLSPIPFDRLANWAVERPADQRVGTGSAPE